MSIGDDVLRNMATEVAEALTNGKLARTSLALVLVVQNREDGSYAIDCSVRGGMIYTENANTDLPAFVERITPHLKREIEALKPGGMTVIRDDLNLPPPPGGKPQA